MQSSVACLEGGCMVGYREYELLGVITCDACLSDCDECELANSGLSTICLDQQCDTGYGIDSSRMCIGRLPFIYLCM